MNILVSFLTLEEIVLVFSSLKMLLVIGLSYDTFIMLSYVPSITTFFRAFIVK
jgi:hypothetical protein